MRTKWLILPIATFVAICHLGLQAQEATEKQLKAMEDEAVAFQQRQEDAAKKSAEAYARLTPEERSRFDALREKINKTMMPPLPTNSAPKMARQPVTKYYSSAPSASRRERMANRIKINLHQILQGESPQMIDVINRHIIELDKRNVSPANIREWIMGPEQAREYEGQGDGYSPEAILANIYSTYNTGGGNYWTRPTQYLLRTAWGPEPRTLVLTNGPSLRTYQGLLADDEAVIYTSLGITNHTDYMGDPSDHIIATWHQLYNRQIGDIYEWQISTNNVHFTTNRSNRHFVWTEAIPVISDYPAWQRTFNFVPAITNWQHFYLSLYLYKSGPQQPGVEAHFDVNSAQWVPYWYPPVNEDVIIEDTGTQMLVQWNTVVYRDQFWQLEFALSLNGPWAPVTNQITQADGISTIAFPKQFAQNRFYRFHHRY